MSSAIVSKQLNQALHTLTLRVESVFNKPSITYRATMNRYTDALVTL